jgi:thymidylate synthase ThyX
MLNMRSFANFLKLRDSEHAQKEVRDLAQKMVFMVKSIQDRPFKYTLKAFGY